MVKIQFMRPTFDRIMRVSTHIIASVGLAILAWDHFLYDQWAIFGAGIATIIALLILLFTGKIMMWLIVAAAWIYAIVIELVRVTDTYAKWGVALIFLAMAFSALATYTNWRLGRYRET